MKFIIYFLLLIFISLVFINCSKKEKDLPPPPVILGDNSIKDITYNAVVDKGTFNYTLTNGKSGKSTVKYIVVDKTATKNEVKKLANKLWYEFQYCDMISIAILTDVEAAKNYENWDYDLTDSWLLLVNKNYKDNNIQYQEAFDSLKD